jgi:hypothetical protein
VAEPRFQLLMGAPRQSPPRVVRVPGAATTGAPRRAGQVTWRLLGANNRELGRSARSFSDQADCWAAIERLKTQLTSAEPRMAILDPRGSWGWQLWVDGDEQAVSARLFSRLRECRYSLDQFLDKVPAAGLTISPPTALDRRQLPAADDVAARRRPGVPR